MTCIFSALIYGRNVFIWEKFNEFIILVEYQATFIFFVWSLLLKCASPVPT